MSHLLQAGTMPPVASESFQGQFHREKRVLNEQLHACIQAIQTLKAEKPEELQDRLKALIGEFRQQPDLGDHYN